MYHAFSTAEKTFWYCRMAQSAESPSVCNTPQAGLQLRHFLWHLQVPADVAWPLLSPRVLPCGLHQILLLQKLPVFCLSSPAKSAEQSPESQLKRALEVIQGSPWCCELEQPGGTTLPQMSLLRRKVSVGLELGMGVPWTATARCQSSCVSKLLVGDRSMDTIFSLAAVDAA